ncbi:MAG: nitronate monooxygenase, partial [Hydrogenophilaceae bacterium]
METPKIVAISPGHLCDPSIAIAALRAGAIAILDLGPGSDPTRSERVTAVRRLAMEGADKAWGIRLDLISGLDPAVLPTLLASKVQYCILAGVPLESLVQARQGARLVADQVFLETPTLAMALAAEQAGYDGVVLKGHEAAGRVGTMASYILLQQAHQCLGLPYWIQGGIGLHTAPAAALAGASGVVLCEQLWATDEGPGNERSRDAWRSFDGSESVYIGDQNAGFRLSSRSARDKLRALEESADQWPSRLAAMFNDGVGEALVPLGQDIAFCGHLANRFGTTGRVIGAYREALSRGLETARMQQTLAADSAFAREHHIRYPILQGPMTRVSDNASFAKAVADAGGLPFIALALLQGPPLRKLLEETREALKGQAWGVGILGFVPLALRQEQLKVIEEIRPPYALVAGGRPSQAQELERLGIAAYLHAPSPGLLVQFIKEGARRFIFEGNECGGHVGPRTSFVLWELAVQALLAAEIDDPESLSILFAGGVHDALSGAMAAVIAAPLSERGIRVGVQMGSAYLFTREAVQTGAILPEFQEQAIRCSGTALLRSGPGQATRCAKTFFCDEFEQTRNALLLQGAAPEVILETLERLNIGRLRIAAKGIARSDGTKAAEAAYMPVDCDTQRREGLYMMGDVATLRDEVIAMADLHKSVCEDAMTLLADNMPTPPLGAAHPATADHDIAVIGMACLLPGATEIQQYWRNILDCVDCISEVDDARWRPEDFFDADRL